MSKALSKVIVASVPIFARYTKPGDLAIISEWDSDLGMALSVVPRPDVGATAIIWLIISEMPRRGRRIEPRSYVDEAIVLLVQRPV